ncbi:hypothetical protein D3C76_1439040 [compost metagenome]
MMATQLVLALAEELTAGLVGTLNFTFQIERQKWLRHGFKQRTQRQMFTFRRHPRHGTDIRNASDTANFSHQAAECIEFDFGKIEVNSPDRVDVDAAQINVTQNKEIE